jgi:hypothetical protein
MGWSEGSSLMSEVIAAVQDAGVGSAARTMIYIDLIRAFRIRDADTLRDCLGEDPAYDVAWRVWFPTREDE